MKFWGLFDIDIFSCIYFAYINISFQLASTCGTVRRRNATHRVRCRVVYHALYKTVALPGASIFRPLLRRVSVCNRNAYFYYRCLSVVTCTESDQVVLFDCLQRLRKGRRWRWRWSWPSSKTGKLFISWVKYVSQKQLKSLTVFGRRRKTVWIRSSIFVTYRLCSFPVLLFLRLWTLHDAFNNMPTPVELHGIDVETFLQFYSCHVLLYFLNVSFIFWTFFKFKKRCQSSTQILKIPTTSTFEKQRSNSVIFLLCVS